jgi:hypothetical protein
MMLGPGSIEWGAKRSALEKFDYAACDLALCHRHEGEWVGLMNVPHLQLGISDAALMAASDEANGEIELRPHRKFADSRLGALAAAVHAEMVAGYPNGRLFLDSVEQAMAVALVSGHAVRHRPVQMSRGGLAPARLRTIRELIDAKMDGELSLDEMARSVGLSTAHFARMFRKSTGEPRINLFCGKGLSVRRRCCVLPMREYWTWPWPVASRPSSTLRRSFVMCVGLARQGIGRIFWATKRLARRKRAPKIRHGRRFVVHS